MRNRLSVAWQMRSPRERVIIVALAAVLGIVLYAWLAYSAGRARAQLQPSVATLRAAAARIERQVLEVERLRAAPGASASTTDLRTLVLARIGAAGLSAALLRIDAGDASQVKVVFGALPFADWLTWAEDLQSQQVRVDDCRIEALSAPGLVSVTATFARARP